MIKRLPEFSPDDNGGPLMADQRPDLVGGALAHADVTGMLQFWQRIIVLAENRRDDTENAEEAGRKVEISRSRRLGYIESRYELSTNGVVCV